MKRFFKPRWLLAGVTGFLFAVYSAYNIFLVFRDQDVMPTEGVFISLAVALMFAVLAAFAWTAGLKGKKFAKFMTIRRVSYIIAMIVLSVFKLRLVGRVIEYFDHTKAYTVLYNAAYFLTLAAMLILLIHYAFVLRILPLHPKAAFRVPGLAAALFFCSLIFEAILFFAYGIGLEANSIRTMVIRPVFYLGFIGLSFHFMFPLSPFDQPKKPDKSITDAPSN